jgi:hypothetical protein
VGFVGRSKEIYWREPSVLDWGPKGEALTPVNDTQLGLDSELGEGIKEDEPLSEACLFRVLTMSQISYISSLFFNLGKTDYVAVDSSIFFMLASGWSNSRAVLQGE